MSRSREAGNIFDAFGPATTVTRPPGASSVLRTMRPVRMGGCIGATFLGQEGNQPVHGREIGRAVMGHPLLAAAHQAGDLELTFVRPEVNGRV